MTNDITILSCPQCGFPRIRDCGNGLYQCDDCGAHFDKDENIVLTEQEWLQTATTEQLAEWIHTAMFDDNFANKIADEAYMNMQTRDDYIEMWLKQPHTPKE